MRGTRRDLSRSLPQPRPTTADRRPTSPITSALRALGCAVAVVAVLVALVPVAGSSAGTLGTATAIVLGVIEGITEFLPVSSTGHLVVAERVLGVVDGKRGEEAAAAYAICLQFGAIAAVVVLYRKRLASVARGLAWRSPDGARLARRLILATAPAGIVGLLLGSTIKDTLFGVGPIVVAWALGGAAILFLSGRLPGGAITLEQLSAPAAVVIGLAQLLALWPGVSRSLVTILAALAVGLTMSAAVEFSFLVGVLTLGAATGYEAVRQGSTIVDTFGLAAPLLGLVAAFLAAVVAVRWLTALVRPDQLNVFGWYRLGLAAVVGVLAVTNAV